MSDKIDHLKELLLRLEDRSLRAGAKLPDAIGFSSELTIAHLARQEINELSDIEYIPAFKQLLAKEKVTINKINLIRHLVRLADKHKRNDIADYILGLVRKEKTRWVNSTSLGALKDSNLEIENEKEILFELANHKDWQIRYDALELLSKLPRSYFQRIEALCLVQVKQYKSKHFALIVLALVMSKVGSKKSIPSLKEIVKDSKKSDAIYSAVLAIDILNGENELEFYLEMYAAKRDSSIKRYLLVLISKYGNKIHCEFMIKRLRSILSKKRTRNWYYVSGKEPEIVTILKFLDKHNIGESQKQINWISNKKMESLDKIERDWITKKMKNAI